jgi:hypothetical protein
MSLINDALKRASQSDRNRPQRAETHRSMEPADHRRGLTLSLVVGAGVVLALVLAGWFFWQWWMTSHSPAPAKVETVATVAPKPAPAPVIRETVAPPAISPPPQALAPAPVSAPTPAPAPSAKPVEAAWPAELKLMGIFFSKTNPRALISGKTVSVGDLIDGIRVTKIEVDRVSVEWNGQVKQLLME